MVRFVLTFTGLMMFSVLIPGCGGGVESGVADAPDEQEPMQTEEEEAGEAQSASDSAGY